MKKPTKNISTLFLIVIITLPILLLVSPFLGAPPEYSKALMDATIVLIPAFVTWFVQTYVKSAKDKNEVALAASLAGQLIGFVEDLDRNNKLDDMLGKLNLPIEVIEAKSQGLKKLKVATEILTQELAHHDIDVSSEEAERLIRSEFQKIAGNLGLNRQAIERTQEGIELLKHLQQAGFINLPAEAQQTTQLADWITEWAIKQSKTADEAAPLRETVLSKAEKTLEETTQAISPNGQSRSTLSELARNAYTQAKKLKAKRQDNTISQEDIALAQLVIDTTKHGLTVGQEELVEAIHQAKDA